MALGFTNGKQAQCIRGIFLMVSRSASNKESFSLSATKIIKIKHKIKLRLKMGIERESAHIDLSKNISMVDV